MNLNSISGTYSQIIFDNRHGEERKSIPRNILDMQPNPVCMFTQKYTTAIF